MQFNGIVPHAAYAVEDRARRHDEPDLRPMSLAQRAGTIAAQIFLLVLSYVAVVPRDAHDAATFNMVNLARKRRNHSDDLEFHQAVADGGHETDFIAVH